MLTLLPLALVDLRCVSLVFPQRNYNLFQINLSKIMNDSRIYITFNVLGKQKGLNPPVELFCTEYGQPIFEVFINYSAFMLFL